MCETIPSLERRTKVLWWMSRLTELALVTKGSREETDGTFYEPSELMWWMTRGNNWWQRDRPDMKRNSNENDTNVLVLYELIEGHIICIFPCYDRIWMEMSELIIVKCVKTEEWHIPHHNIATLTHNKNIILVSISWILSVTDAFVLRHITLQLCDAYLCFSVGDFCDVDLPDSRNLI